MSNTNVNLADMAYDGVLDARALMVEHPINWNGITEHQLKVYLGGFAKEIERQWKKANN